MFIEADLIFSFSYKTSHPEAALKISRKLLGKSTVAPFLCNITAFLTRKNSAAIFQDITVQLLLLLTFSS